MKTNSEHKHIYRASKKSVEKALDLFKDKKHKLSRSYSAKQKNEDETNRKIKIHCTSSIPLQTLHVQELGFGRSYALTEMSKCLSRHEWTELQKLFPLLLKLTREKHCVIWRYAMIILLNSLESKASNISEFIQLCVENQTELEPEILKNLLTFPKEEES